MSQPAPDFTCVLTLIDASLVLAVWIHAITPTRFDLTFELHLASPLTVWVHAATTTCFDFCFDLHVDPPINRCHLYEHLHRF